jgi:pescadillo protein
MNFFLGREIPHGPLELLIKSFGGEVGWDGEGSPFNEKEEIVTHQLVDRPQQATKIFAREYVQPQWVFDSINTKLALPTEKYAPGASLPPVRTCRQKGVGG